MTGPLRRPTVACKLLSRYDLGAKFTCGVLRRADEVVAKVVPDTPPQSSWRLLVRLIPREMLRLGLLDGERRHAADGGEV
jgi:hypothetical protein